MAEKSDQTNQKEENYYEIVIVDDNTSVCKSLIRAINHFAKNAKLNIYLQDYQDPERAYKYIRDKKVDLVISDIRMPFMTGDVFIAKIKEQLPDIPVLVVTGYATKDNILSVYKADPKSIILSKPWQPERLYESITTLLNIKLEIPDENK